MRNRFNFANVVGILLENKKKTYQQHQLVRSLFSLYLDDELESADLLADDNTLYIRWCTGVRPVPLEIIRTYEYENGWGTMENDFEEKIIPNLLNETQARLQMEELIHDSRNIIGDEKIDELIALQSLARFFTATVRYAVLNEHSHSTLYSPDLSDILIGGRVPSYTKGFVGRKLELSTALTALRNKPLLFVTGVAGIGKSKFAKVFAQKNKKKYTNIIFLHYTGDLKKCIAQLEFANDSVELDEDDLFDAHYSVLKKLRSDSLLIIDNFNVLPKDDSFFNELIKNDFQILITTRCKVTTFDALELTELDKDKELTELFYHHCPSAKNEPDTVSAIIDILNCHTLTACLAALALCASGMEPDELLHELQTCGLNNAIGEDIEIYKDDEFSEALMIEHLRKLLQINRLSVEQSNILCNLSLLPLSGKRKTTFKKWLRLRTLNDVNHLVRYGFIMEDTENNIISLHPLIQDIAMFETMPSVTRCQTILKSLHNICITHGREVRRPEAVINSLMSINEHIVDDLPEAYLLFLQDQFPYFEKYGVTHYLPELTSRIESVMQEHCINTPSVKALLLDYKAMLFYIKKDYSNALKKHRKALDIIAPLLTTEADIQIVNLASNINNNLANVYLATNRADEAADALTKALMLRRNYAHLGIAGTHDTLQQLGNLVSLLLQIKEYEQAVNLLAFYENIVTDYEGADTFDYGVCLYIRGYIAYHMGNATQAEAALLAAEKIFIATVGTDHEYTCATYRYLYSLYARHGLTDKSESYKTKLLERQK